MSQATVAGAVYHALVADAALDALLARTSIPPGLAAAIYDTWAGPGTALPYLVLDWTAAPGQHWAQRESALVVHIFAPGPSASAALAIRDRVLERLDRRHLPAAEAGIVRLYAGPDGRAAEDSPEIVHWTVQVTASYWRRSFLEQLTY